MKPVISFLLEQLKFLKSLRFRIFMLLMLAGAIPCIIVSESTIVNYRIRALSLKTTEAVNQCRILANHLATANYLDNPHNEISNSEIEQLSSFYDGRIMIVDESFKVIYDSYGLAVGRTMISKEVIDCRRNGSSETAYDKKGRYIELSTPIMDIEGGSTQGVMFASISTDSVLVSMDILRRKAWIIIITASILIFFGAMILARMLVMPFERIANTIASIEQDFGTEQVSIPDYTETESIMEAFYKLMSRMKSLDESRQEFVSNVSHELKTPLASMKVLADSIRGEDNVPIETYREFMDGITEEVDRENEIITDLLSLVKMDKTAGVPNVESTDINGLLDEVINRLKPLAEQKEVSIFCNAQPGIAAEVDRTKLSLALTNLIENGIKYNVPEGWVKVELEADHQFFTLTVSDSGIGIPEEALDHIYERFYRVDESHSNTIDGTGLGLAITRTAVLLHRGAIRASSEEGKGTSFIVRIPLKYAYTLS